MLNLGLGAPQIVEGRECISTKKGCSGYAVYGPYQQLVPGRYVVTLGIKAQGETIPKHNTRLAVIDVSIIGGKRQLVRQDVLAADLASGARTFTISFTADQPCRAEYRVWVSGKASLLIEDNHFAVPVSAEGLSYDVIADTRFPLEAGETIPFFREHRAQLKALFDQGVIVRVVGGSVRLEVSGVALHARCADDLRFIGELFLENAYNFGTNRPVCVVDIGMNIGLASLQFAKKAEVREVHSFEPFAATYDRATANLALNPSIADKITPHRYGLADADYDGPIRIDDHGDSGAMTTIGVAGGSEVHLTLKDAGPLLGPIIEDAVARGLDVVVKIDCEGSEFAIFQSLVRHRLLEKICAFLVEWHALFDGSTQHTLLGPLKDAGFFIVDRSPPIGNGFFYAVRTH